MLPEAKRFDSITAIGREAWNACFSGALEDYDYLLAVENAHIKGFEHCYYAVMEAGISLAVAPAFVTDYDLATTAEGAVRTMLLAIKRFVPLTLKLACLGSTATEHCPIGFHPSLDSATKQALFSTLIAFFEHDTKQRGIHLLALKDVSNEDNSACAALLRKAKFHPVTGMPSALSNASFPSIDGYLATLSAATRKDMRRKLKKRNDIRIDYRRNIDDCIDAVYAMYLETKARSDTQFEELTRDYFTGVLKHMGERALCSLYYAGEQLIGANLMLVNRERLLDKFFCMYTDAGQDYNLYFVSWLANMQYCIDHGIPFYQSGQAGYETKLRLGSDFLANWMYFKHRNPIINALLKLAAPLLAFDVPERQLSAD